MDYSLVHLLPRRDIQKGARLVTPLDSGGSQMCHQERSWRRAKEMPPHLQPPEPPRYQPAPSASLCSHQLLPGSPQWARRWSSPRIKADEDFAVGFRQAQVQQSRERTWMKDTSGSNKASNKPWAPSQLSKLANLSFQNPKQPSPDWILQLQGGTPTSFCLPARTGWLWIILSYKKGYWITFDSSSLVIIPLPTSWFLAMVLCPESHRPVSMGTLPIHRNSHEVINECVPRGRRDHS